MPSSVEPQTKRPGWFRSLEEGSGSGWAYFLLLIGWILLRNLLEGVLESPHQLGFDWREEISFAMIFLHFPLFYLNLFLVYVLWIHLLTGRSIRSVSRVVCVGFGLLLVAPLFDAILSGGRGYDLRYLLRLDDLLWRFWDPRVALEEVSPGQRVEIVAAMLLAAAYCYQAQRGWPRRVLLALVSGLGVYLLAALLGAWPSLFAGLFSTTSQQSAEAYVQVYQMHGLIGSESRRLALVMVLPILPLLVAFLWRLAPGGFAALTRKIGWSRLIYYTGLAPAGIFIGALVYGDALPQAFSNPSDAVAAVVLWAAVAAAFVAARIWNDLHDREADRRNEPARPLVTGELAVASATQIGTGAALLALFLAVCVSYPVLLLMVGCLFLAWSYSTPPLRLKRFPLLATLVLALLSLVSLAIGFALFAQEMTPLVFPRRLALYLLIGVTLGFGAKDLKDEVGDRATGVVTLATLWGARRARIIAALLLLFCYVLAPLFLPLGWRYALLAAIGGLASAATVLWRRRPDTILLVGFLLFALLTALLLARSPVVLREQVPAVLRILHTDTRALEEQVRIGRLADEQGRDPALSGETIRALACARADRLLALIPSAAAAELPALASSAAWHERLHWSRAQSCAPIEARGSVEWLIAERPLRAAYWEQALGRAIDVGDARAGVHLCDEALARGVRPGDFRRNRAALRLKLARSEGGKRGTAGGVEGSAENRRRVKEDLHAASLWGREKPLLWVLTGDLLQHEQKAGDACAAYGRAIDLQPQRPDAWAGLGEALLARGEGAEAVTALRRARELEPQDPWIANNLGVALLETGAQVEARTLFEHAHRLAPTLFEPLFNLGREAERRGEPAEARRWFEQAQRVRPGFPPLIERLRRLPDSKGR